MTNKTAVIFGAGKIARGFIAHLLALSGYQISFVEKSMSLVELLRERRKYGIEIMGSPERSAVIEGFDVLASSEEERVAEALAGAGVVFISIGGPNLPDAARLLAAGIRRANAQGRREPLNTLICENAFQPASLLRKHIASTLGEAERQWFNSRVGLVETMVLRSTIEPTEAMKARDPLALKAQDAWELPCDASAFVGTLPPIRGLAPQPQFQHALVRKLFTYNRINAVVAYSGYLKGYQLLSEAANDAEIVAFVEETNRESDAALCRRYGFDAAEQRAFASSALAKYQRPEIVDPIERNARDPIRKLGRHDRLVGPACLAFEEGISPDALCRAVGLALHYTVPGDPSAQQLQAAIQGTGVLQAIYDICGIDGHHEIAQRIRDAYDKVRVRPRPSS